MKTPARWICGTAVLLATMTLQAETTPLEWNLDANGNWGDAANWNPQAVPSASHDVLLGTVITADRTLTPGQNLQINSLSIAPDVSASYRFDRAATADEVITLLGGNVTVGAGGPLHYLTHTGSAAFANRIRIQIPNDVQGLWEIEGDLRVGPIQGVAGDNYSSASSIVKTGAGMLELFGAAGDFRGDLTVEQGTLRIRETGSHSNLGTLRVEPAGGEDARLEGGGTLLLASGKHVVLAGTASAEAVVSPGDGNAIGTLTLGSTDGDVSFEDNSRLTVALHATATGSSDTLEVRGRLNLGAPGTANILELQPQDPNQPLSGTYTLASYVAGLTGTFDAIYYDGALVADPTTAIGDTGYQLVYGGDAILIKPVDAILVEWTGLGANNRWDNPDNWSTAPSLPAFNGTESVRIVVASAQTQTLDGNRAILDLDVTGSLTLESGSVPDSRLILTSGNMLLEAAGVNWSQFPNFQGIVLQVGDGGSPVDDAVWMINNTGSANLRHARFGAVAGIAGTAVTMQGNNRAHFNNPSPHYLGDWFVNLDNGRRISVNADSAMGLGTVTMVNPVNNSILFNRGADDGAGVQSSQHDTRFVLDGPTGIAIMNQRATIRGGLGGAGALRIGRTGSTGVTGFPNTITLEGGNHDASGDVNVEVGTLEVNGLWTGAGSIRLTEAINTSPQLAGSGTIALAQGKTVTLTGRLASSVYYYRRLAPGSTNPTGTLTIGTPAGGNEVRLNAMTRLDCALSTTTPGASSRLAVNGTLNLAGASDKELRLYRLGDGKLAGDYTLATYDSRSGTFDRVYLDDVEVVDPTVRNGVGDTHQLVYEETALLLVAAPPSGTLILLR